MDSMPRKFLLGVVLVELSSDDAELEAVISQNLQLAVDSDIAAYLTINNRGLCSIVGLWQRQCI